MSETQSETNGRNYRQLARLGGFYLVGLAFVVLLYVFVGSLIELGIRSWFSNVAGDHRIHEITIATMIFAATVGVVIQAYRPRNQLAALQTAIIVFLVPTIISGLTGGRFIEPGTFLVLAVVMGLLHPSWRGMLRPFTEGRYSPRLAALVVVAAIPLLAFAVDQAMLQLTLADEHAVVGHYGDQAAYVINIILLGLLAAIKTRGWWFPALATGVLAVDQGLASVFFSTTSSVGQMWGGLEILWGLVFIIVAAAEYRGIVGEDLAREREQPQAT